MRRIAHIIAGTLLILAAVTAAASNIPSLEGRITDKANILSPATRATLTEALKGHEQRTGNQIAVLIVRSLEGESIEEYAESVFQSWKLGQKGKDNGILVVVASEDRRVRIEVGYGLEPVLPDSLAGSIMRNVMTPRFKTGDYDEGVKNGIAAIMTVLENGHAPDLGDQQNSAGSSAAALPAPPEDQQPQSVIGKVVMGIFIFGLLGLFIVLGILSPRGGWMVYFILLPFIGIFPFFVIGTTKALAVLVAYLAGFPLAKMLIRKTAWYERFRLRQASSSGGDDDSSRTRWSRESFSSSNDSDSSDDFSGGGGSSGGGGASSDW